MNELILSLFPGVGLLDRAFDKEGFCVVRGPDVLWGGDIKTFHPPAGPWSGCIGGPPCQAFSSLANFVRAKGLEPRFGNLIPEFERVVGEARPAWFLMENVPAAPLPDVHGYQTTSFVLDNCVLDSGDGYGEQQERKRRFSFGLRDRPAPSLLRWIRPAALLLPRAGTVIQTHVNNSQEAKGRTREQAVVHAPVCASSDGGGLKAVEEGCSIRLRVVAVTGAHSGAAARPKGGHLIVYRWARMVELQGLPPDFLADAPFTVEGKRKALANGVPLPMGRALARAVRLALGLPLVEREAPA